MKIDFPRVYRPLRLAEFAEEFGEEAITVWVNPPKAVREQFAGIVTNSARARQKLTLTTNEATNKRISAKARKAPEAVKASKGPDVSTGEAVAELEKAGGALITWLAGMWDDWSEEEIRKLTEETLEDNPAFYPWLVRRTFEMIGEYRRGGKKK